MRKRSAVRNGIEYCAEWIALTSLQSAPQAVANRLARFYARLLDAAIPRLRRVARQNLAMALPEYTPQKHAEIVDGVFRSVARVLVAFEQVPSIRQGHV